MFELKISRRGEVSIKGDLPGHEFRGNWDEGSSDDKIYPSMDAFMRQAKNMLKALPDAEKADLTFKAADEEKRMVYAEVYAPDRPDTDGEFMTAVEIEKMAHQFLRDGRTKFVDVQHKNETYDGVEVVESWVAKDGDPIFIPGSWVVGVHIPNDELWQAVKSGELNGFSMESAVLRRDADVEIEIPEIVSGTTTKEDGHTHLFFVKFDIEGQFLGGCTDAGPDGHVHQIIAGTKTEKVAGHSHRFSSVDPLEIISA